MPAVILVVEDQELEAALTRQVLEGAGYRVFTAPSLFRAKGFLEKFAPELVILDRRLPDGDGFEFCRQMRDDKRWKGLPILFLSGKHSVSDKVSGLELGADDYLAKPYSPDELVARVHALLRKHGGDEAAPVLQSGTLRMDLVQIKATLDGAPLKLWPKEFELLKTLLGHPDQVHTREQLLQAVWGYEKELQITSKTVDVTVSRLRKKLGKYGKRIEFVRGYGYRYSESPS